MPDYQERLDRIDIVKSSPDGSVRVAMTGPGAIRVTVMPSAMDSHTEGSLAEQIECAAAVVAHDHAAAQRKLIDDILGAEFPQPEDAAGRRERTDSALARLEGSGKSPWGYVTATWRGIREVHIRLRSRTLRLLNAERLGDEIAAALASAQLHRKKVHAGPASPHRDSAGYGREN